MILTEWCFFICSPGFEKWMKLVKVDRDTEVQGEVHLEATLVEENGRKRVRLKVIEARQALLEHVKDEMRQKIQVPDGKGVNKQISMMG